MSAAIPYRSTPVFNEATLPAALRSEHRTKAEVWGVIRVTEGRLKLTYLDPVSETIITPGVPRADPARATAFRGTARGHEDAGRFL